MLADTLGATFAMLAFTMRSNISPERPG